MRVIVAAAVILLVSWVPLFVVGFLDPTSNPVGLGLLAMAGTPIAGIVLAFGLLRLLWIWARS